MKLTSTQLRRIINEESSRLREARPDPRDESSVRSLTNAASQAETAYVVVATDGSFDNMKVFSSLGLAMQYAKAITSSLEYSNNMHVFETSPDGESRFIKTLKAKKPYRSAGHG